MPLKAIVDGRPVIGPDLSGEEWADLRQRHAEGLPVRMSCCGSPGHLRSSRNGLQHFYHATGTGCGYAEESRDHLEIKYRIYRACMAEGWEASVEFPAPDRRWISDVYAVREGRKIVFEIQISAISPDDLAERDKRYRNEGIESYWLLDTFPGRGRDFTLWYDSDLYGEGGHAAEPLPYLDPSLFETGPENHLFIPKGIRSIGLHAEKQLLYTTNNPAIPLAAWVREVLNGNYRDYLEETAAAYHRKRRLRTMAAPSLIRFREWYHNIVRSETYRKEADRCHRILAADKKLPDNDAIHLQMEQIFSEIAWLEQEYRTCMAESSGLFSWKKIPGNDTPRPFFRLESESKVRKLQECVQRFERWEESFTNAIKSLERAFAERSRSVR